MFSDHYTDYRFVMKLCVTHCKHAADFIPEGSYFTITSETELPSILFCSVRFPGLKHASLFVKDLILRLLKKKTLRISKIFIILETDIVIPIGQEAVQSQKNNVTLTFI